MTRHRFVWMLVVLALMGATVFQAYNLGYDSARWTYEDREFDLKKRHADEVIDAIKGMPSPEVRAFLNVTVGEQYPKANEKLEFLGYRMMDYLTANDDDTYDSHWAYKNDEKPTQTWVSLTIDKGTNKVVKKTLHVRVTPGR